MMESARGVLDGVQILSQAPELEEGECLCFSFHVALGEEASVPLMCAAPILPARHLLTTS